MSITLTVITVFSWLLLLLMVFQYERLDKRLAGISVLTEELLQAERAIMQHMGILPAESDKVKELRAMVTQGRVFEAQAAYRMWSGSTHKEALLYINTLRSNTVSNHEENAVE
jgi:hypothetical protein